MMGKAFAFMAGLPRTGSTLLSCVLSQNPAIYLSPQSGLSAHLKATYHRAVESEDWLLGVTQQQHSSLLRNMIPAYYADTKADVVIDKSRHWGTPFSIRLLAQVLDTEPRILCPLRPLTEIVASFVRKAQANPNNHLDREMVEHDFLPYSRKPIDDARVDWLLRPGGMLDTAMLSVASAFQGDTAHLFHVYSYADLVNEPKHTLDRIHDFLNIKRYPYDFDVIPAAQPHADFEVLGIHDLHHVRQELRDTAPPPESVLSDYAMSRCVIEDFWTER